VGLGGEVFNEFGKAIKSASPFRTTFVMTHCNGAGGYVLTRPSYEEGGYEVQSSPFAPGAGEQLVEEVTRLLRELKEAREAHSSSGDFEAATSGVFQEPQCSRRTLSQNF
jgi:hypothetical protein